ncbi:MAG: SPOR domain-containing protein [Thiomonas sp.]
MNDDLEPLKNRLRWLNRSILVLGILILLGLVAWAVFGLRQTAPGSKSTVIHPASSASNLATRAASAVATAQPKPAMSTAQQERAAAAAMNALSAASAPQTGAAAATASEAAAVSSAPANAASAPIKTQTAIPQTASSAVRTGVAPRPAPERAAPKPKPVAQPKRAGAVGVCRTAGWYVQVGAFGKQQSIDRLAQKLHRAGYTRVCVAARQVRGLHLFFVGPYKNAAAARDARAPLRKLTGVEGILRKLG